MRGFFVAHRLARRAQARTMRIQSPGIPGMENRRFANAPIQEKLHAVR
jgi:hypothetical protein